MSLDFLPDVIDARFLIIQGLGVVGFAIYIASMQLLKPRQTVLAQAVADIFFVFHYWGLSQVFVVFLAGFAFFRDFGSAFLDSRKWHKVLLAVYLMALYSTAFFWADKVSDVLGLLGSTAITAAQFFRDRFYLYRGLSVIHQIFWTAVYVMIFSVPGVLFMASILISNIIGVIRYMRDPDQVK